MIVTVKGKFCSWWDVITPDGKLQRMVFEGLDDSDIKPGTKVEIVDQISWITIGTEPVLIA